MALDRTCAGLGTQHHGAASLALIPSSELISHVSGPSFMRGPRALGPPGRLSDQVFFVMGWPQQLTVPFSEPLVTTNSEPHVPQKYRFPVSIAKLHTSSMRPHYKDYSHGAWEGQRSGTPLYWRYGRPDGPGFGQSACAW